MLSNAVEREIAEHDVTYEQWGVLSDDPESAATPPRCCRAGMECDTGSMTRMLDRLEAKELIVRTRIPTIAAACRSSLTQDGKRLAARLIAAIVKVLNRHLEGFSADELKLFKGFLRRMLANREAPC